MKQNLSILLRLIVLFHSIHKNWSMNRDPLHRLIPPGTYTSYSLGPVCRPLDGIIHSPRNEQEAVDLVKRAIKSYIPIKAFGGRHSVTDIICVDAYKGIALDMSNIKSFRMNPDSTVTVGAGVTIRELGEFLHRHGRSIRIIPAYGGITIGGALGTAAHGSSLKYESIFSEYTVSLKIIDGKGVIRTIKSPGALRGYRAHLGLLGVILQVTLQTVMDFKVYVHNYETSDEILFNGLWEPMARAADSFFLYWFPARDVVVVSNGTFVTADTPGRAWSNDHVPPTSQTFHTVTYPALEILQKQDSYSGLNMLEKYMQKTLTTQVPLFAPIYTEDGKTVANPGIGFAYKMLAAVCAPHCPWHHSPFNLSMIDNELSLDIRNMAEIATTVKDILAKSPAAFPMQGILLRFSKSTDTFLAPGNGRDSVHFEWYSVKRKNQYDDPISGMEAYQTMMQTLAFTFGGRSHWGKSGMYYHSRGVLQQKFNPKTLDRFLTLRSLADPDKIFINNFGRRLLDTSDKIDLDPITTHCAVLDNCVCRLPYDCAPEQYCGMLPGYLKYRVCRNVPKGGHRVL